MEERANGYLLTEENGIEDDGAAVGQDQDRPFAQVTIAARGETVPEHVGPAWLYPNDPETCPPAL